MHLYFRIFTYTFPYLAWLGKGKLIKYKENTILKGNMNILDPVWNTKKKWSFYSVLESIDEEPWFIFAFVCNYHGVTASEMINSSTSYLCRWSGRVAFAITKCRSASRSGPAACLPAVRIFCCWERTSGKSDKGVPCLWPPCIDTGVFSELSRTCVPSQVTVPHSADSRDVIGVKALGRSLCTAEERFSQMFCPCVLSLRVSKKPTPFLRASLEKARLKTAAKLCFIR